MSDRCDSYAEIPPLIGHGVYSGTRTVHSSETCCLELNSGGIAPSHEELNRVRRLLEEEGAPVTRP